MTKIKPEDAEASQSKLLQMLAAGVVLFLYEKQDQTMRLAFGTKKEDLLPASKKVADDYAQLLESARVVTDSYKKERDANEAWAKDSKSAEAGKAWEVASDHFETQIAFMGQIVENNKPKSKKPAKEVKEVNPLMITYYDFEAQGIRSFNVKQLRGIFDPLELNNG